MLVVVVAVALVSAVVAGGGRGGDVDAADAADADGGGRGGDIAATAEAAGLLDAVLAARVDSICTNSRIRNERDNSKIRTLWDSWPALFICARSALTHWIASR